MSRPKPRKSVLAGQSPITPLTPAAPETPATPETPALPAKQKITVTIDSQVANQARQAYLIGLPSGGPPTLSKWIEDAIAARLNQQMKPQEFQGLPPGHIPTGRPMNHEF